MRFTAVLFTVASALLATSTSNFAVADPVVGGYLLINPIDGAAKLKALADRADNIPINRLFLSFVRPTMVYVPGSNTLKYVGLGYSKTGDYGFADLKAQVAKLQKGGVEVLLSMGGWNYGCYPYLYTYYSVGGYGTETPNYWKIKEYGSLAGCNESNMWCYTCEPKEQGTTIADFDMFPEPSYSKTWKQAEEYVKEFGQGGVPVYQYDMIPGKQWKDPKTAISTVVPGSSYFFDQKRDPYQDLVYLAKDLGLAGVDVDYEEMWHADYFKGSQSDGSWTNYQTVYKYATIMRDVQLNIQDIAPKMKLGTASAAVGAWQGKWWGGNLKGVWYWFYKWYPEVYNFAATGANSGGVNVMSYDLSSNEKYHECPVDGLCSLSQQVNFYMDTYKTAGMAAHVGYEIGTPAYPDHKHDPDHQLPLTQTALTAILNVQGKNGGFFWELYKKGDGFVDPTPAAQQICKAALGANAARCSGVIPPFTSRTWSGGEDEEEQLSFSESPCGRKTSHFYNLQ